MTPFIPGPDSAGDVLYANFGHYRVGDKFFFSNVDAFRESNKTGQTITHHFYDDEFKHSHALGLWKNMSLDALYLQRAWQMRQQYDVVAVNFSGGWDSRTTLESFERAGCHVDFIVIQVMPEMEKSAVLGDRSPMNWLSEITHAAHPFAYEFCKRNPRTKLIALDWVKEIIDDFTTKKDNLEYIFMQSVAKPGLMYSRNSAIQRNQEFQNALTGGKVACLISGIDKPMISHNNLTSPAGAFPENFLAKFKIARRSAGYQENIIHEAFFWSPHLPELAIKGWYEIYKLCLLDKSVRLATDTGAPNQLRTDTLMSAYVQSKMKSALYPTFDESVWQVDKPRDWGFLITHEVPIIKLLDSTGVDWQPKLMELFDGVSSVIGASNVVKRSSSTTTDSTMLLGDAASYYQYRSIPFELHRLDIAYLKSPDFYPRTT